MKKIILVDGNSLMFRSYYATAYANNFMQNKQGIYTNAVFGFCNMMNKLLEEEKTHILIAFDAGKKTLRHQAYDDYKGTRKALPDELRMQIPYIKRFLDILHVKRHELDDYEADDILATVATSAARADFDEIKIITGDKDLLQLVDDKIKVYITRKGATELEEFNQHNFFEKMGILPQQIPDYKGLVGDTSDNLPGIKGIGEKTAIKLLQAYQSLEGILSNIDDIKGKLQSTIQEGQAMGIQCKQLALLEKEIPLTFSLDDMKVKDFAVLELAAFYQELEFDSFIKRLNLTTAVTEVENSKIIAEPIDFSTLGDATISVEQFGSNYYNGQFLGIGIVTKKEKLFALPQALQTPSFAKWLEASRIDCFDAKKAYVVLRRNNIYTKTFTFDCLLAAYLINPNYAHDDVKSTVDHFINQGLYTDDEVYGVKSKAKIPDLDKIADHSIHKCLALQAVKPVLTEQLEKNNQLDLMKTELALSSVLADMERNGLLVSKEKLMEVEKELLAMQEESANKIYELAGETFNIQSVKQLGEILFQKLKLPSGKKTKTGFSTNVDVLEKLAPKYEIAQLVLDYRGISKLISTYIQGLYPLMDEENYVHPLYRQAYTTTGRLSSIEPNIQNIPIRTENGQVIREAFVSRFPNGKIMSSDYSQIELRVLAHMAQDEKMIQMFHDQVDFHTQTAAHLYEVAVDAISKEQRRTAKAINFGIIYGMSAWGLHEAINISPMEANVYIEKYFNKFSRVKQFLDNTVAQAKKEGFVRTLFSRIRFLPELGSENKALVAFGERTAMNSPIQGTAADIIKMAMVEVAKKMKGLRSLLIAQVHDELVFDVAPDEIETLAQLIKMEMESVVKLLVPLVVEIGIGDNWLDT